MLKITKKLYAPLFAAFVMFAATSCKKTDMAAPAVEENTDELVQFIKKTTGESNVTYSAATKNFIIDGDAQMSLNDAKEHMKNYQANGEQMGAASTESVQHRKSYYSVAPAKATNITIFADATVPAVWLTALDNAIVNWNNAGSLIKVTRVTTRLSTSMLVTAVNNGANGTIATAYYPDYNSNVGRSCTINTAYNYLSASYQTFAMTHELGHAFGFGHTNSTYGTLVPGTPNSDGYSVMNSVCKNWVSFSTYDLLAIRTVYPKY